MRSIDRQSIRSTVLSGCFMGLALGVKYPAIVLLGLLTTTLLIGWNFTSKRLPKAQRAYPVIAAIIFVVTALVVGGCWYLRALLNTGNPVFPYFRHLFGGAGLDEVLDPSRRSMPVTPWSVLTAIVPMTLYPDRFESFAHQFGPTFLLLLPLLLIEKPPRRVVALVAIGYGFLMICVTQRQSMRFVLTSIGPLSVGIAYLANLWQRRASIPSRLLLGLLALMLAMESTQAMARCRGGLKLLAGVETTEDYLSRREPTYPVGQWIARNLKSDARVIGQDHRGFYLPRDYTMELAHRRRTGLGRFGESSDEVINRLRSSGFTHLLLCPPIPQDAVEFDPTLSRVLKPWLATHQPLFRQELADADGIVRRYEIYSLSDQSSHRSTRVQASGGMVR
jgi:hypothetical protein